MTILGQNIAGFFHLPGGEMEHANPNVSSSRWTSVLTDVHFWVPVAALLAGLLLLSFLR